VPQRVLPALTCGLAVAAAWLAVPVTWFLPVLWLALLLVVLALPAGERRLMGPGWAGLGVALLGLSWVASLDHELAMRLSLGVLATALLFGLSRSASPSDGWLAVVAAGVAATGLVTIWQELGGLANSRALVATLPLPWRESAAIRIAGGRAFGTSALPGHCAAMLLLAIPILVSRAVRARALEKVAWGVALVVACAGVVATRSAAAVLIAAVLLALATPLARNRLRLALAGTGLVIAVGALLLVLRPDLAELEPLALRWVNWRTAVWVFAHHPWTGVGLGGVGQAALTAPTAASNITPFTHNTYLELVAEFGIAGFGVVVAGVVALARVVLRGLAVDRALALAVLVVPLHNLIDFSAYAPEVVLPWAVLCGALVARTAPLPRRSLPGWLLVPVLSAGVVISTLTWRGESALAHAASRPGDESIRGVLAAAVWTPWEITPVWVASERALAKMSSPSEFVDVLHEIEARSWIRPQSSAVAEARARLLLGLDRPGEALVWAREARRRAPWRHELVALEQRCEARP
jgi:hypothetical protein